MEIYFEGADLSLKSSTARELASQTDFNIRHTFLNQKSNRIYDYITRMRKAINLEYLAIAGINKKLIALDIKMYRPGQNVIQDSTHVVRDYAINYASGVPKLDTYIDLFRQYPDFQNIIHFINSGYDKQKWLQVRQANKESISSIDRRINTKWFETMERAISDILKLRYGDKVITLDTTGMTSREAAEEVRRLIL